MSVYFDSYTKKWIKSCLSFSGVIWYALMPPVEELSFKTPSPTLNSHWFTEVCVCVFKDECYYAAFKFSIIDIFKMLMMVLLEEHVWRAANQHP